ncbi:MAG: helix-turn-helix domain-containing protein [Clostridiales bacterium]|nr:helix-turn-helix domain-containing protein [Clostridiales bacterium]
MSSSGFGRVYQAVMRNRDISIESKAIYAYLSSFAGEQNTCFPSVETMQRDLGIGKARLTKNLNALITAGIVERERERNGNLLGRNLYRLSHEPEKMSKADSRSVEIEAVEIRSVDGRSVEDEAAKKNRRNINSQKGTVREIVNLFNSICVSYPRVTKLSERRKKAIEARLRSGYTLEDFKRLFEMAEQSDFLKGKNNRSWTASFDWLVQDGNAAKVLDGNYSNPKNKREVTANDKDSFKGFKLWE